MPRFKGRFVSSSNGGAVTNVDGGDSTDDVDNGGAVVSGYFGSTGIGVHVLVATTVAAILIIFIVIPEFSYKPTRRLRPEDLDPDVRILVPNRLVQLNTPVIKVNRITGDRTTMKSQDAGQDEIVLAPRSVVQGEYTVMVQGDAVPIHAELLDTVGWLRERDCEKRSFELGYLVV